MSRPHRVLLIHTLRRRRRRFATVLLCIATLWTVSSFAQCLHAPLTSAMTSTAQPDPQAKAGDTCCPPTPCAATAQNGASSGDAAVPLTGIKFRSVVVLAIATLLLTVSVPRKLALPPQALLPKRPRALKFYALRI